MEGQFPKNVKQVGNVSDSPKIYVEDYVDTYFSQLTEQGRESLVGVFLIGKNTVIEEQECIFVTGQRAIHWRRTSGNGKDGEQGLFSRGRDYWLDAIYAGTSGRA